MPRLGAEFLLVPPPPPWEDDMSLPPPPAEGEYLLVPPPPPWEDDVSLPPPPAEGEFFSFYARGQAQASPFTGAKGVKMTAFPVQVPIRNT